MKTLLASVAAIGVAGLVHAHPLVIEESSRIAPPPGVESLRGQVALDGNEAVALNFFSYPDEGGDDFFTITSAYLFRRDGNTWTYVRKLAEGTDHSADDATNSDPISMKNGVLALAFEPMYIFERENGTWVQKLIGAPPGQPSAWHEPASEVKIDGGRIFLGSGSWGGGILEKDSTTGNWVGRAGLSGDYSGDGDNSVGGDIDLSPNWAVVASPYNDGQLPAPATHVFQRMGTSWPLHARLVPEPAHTFGDVAIRDNEMFIGDYARFGVGVWRRNFSNEWYRADSLRTAIDFTSPGPYGDGVYGNAIVKSDQYVFQQHWNADRGAFVVNVFQADGGSGPYRHVAILAAKDGIDLDSSISPSGRGVLVSGSGGIGPYYFELPQSFAQPALFQDTFATGNGLGWTSLPGSQFAVVQSGNTRVFRQTSTAGEAGAVLDAYDWTNQAIQADVKPTAVNGNNRWVGLATRRTDASNYYYVTLRSSGIIQLKRIQGGAFATLDSASVPWALNRTYRLRLESVGTLHRVYVDGNLVLEAWDDALSHGRAALLSYRTAADYDNVIVSPFLTQTIYSASQGERRESAAAAARALDLFGQRPVVVAVRRHRSPFQADLHRDGCARGGRPGAGRLHRSDRGGARAAARVQRGRQSLVRPHGQIPSPKQLRLRLAAQLEYLDAAQSAKRHRRPAGQCSADRDAQHLVHRETRSGGVAPPCLCEPAAGPRRHRSPAHVRPRWPRDLPSRGRLRRHPGRRSVGRAPPQCAEANTLAASRGSHHESISHRALRAHVVGSARHRMGPARTPGADSPVAAVGHRWPPAIRWAEDRWRHVDGVGHARRRTASFGRPFTSSSARRMRRGITPASSCMGAAGCFSKAILPSSTRPVTSSFSNAAPKAGHKPRPLTPAPWAGLPDQRR